MLRHIYFPFHFFHFCATIDFHRMPPKKIKKKITDVGGYVSSNSEGDGEIPVRRTPRPTRQQKQVPTKEANSSTSSTDDDGRQLSSDSDQIEDDPDYRTRGPIRIVQVVSEYIVVL